MRVNELISKIKEYYKKNKTRIDYLFSVIFLPLTFIITFLIRNYHVFLYESTKTGDYAANGLQIIRAGMFKELLGPYSRFEFNHPGPISFYYYAFMEKILFFIKHDSAKHFLSQFLINSIFIIISLHIIHTSFKKNKTRNTIIFFTLILFFIKYIGLYKIISLWGPDIILFPMLLFILSSSKVAQGNLKHLILSIISSVFIVHNQLGGLITVIPIFTLSILFLINQKRKEKKKITKKDWRIIIYSGALSFISLFPIFVDQLFYNKNLSKIFTFFKQNAGIQHSFLESSKFIIDFIINPLPEILKINTIIILSFFLTMTIFGFNKKNKFLNFTILFVYFGIFLSIYGAIKVVGDLLPYIFNYIHMIILIFYFIIVISALSFFRKNISKIISFTLIILCIIYILHFPHYGNPIKASFKESPHKFIEFIQPSYNYTYRFNSPKGTVHHDRWPIKATIIYELKKDNYNLCVPNEWLFMFGQEFSCENKENIVNIILYTSNKINQSKLNNSFTNKGTTIEIKK